VDNDMIWKRLPVAGATAIALVLQGAAMAGDIYRWAGEDGQPHFSDIAPPDRDTVIHHSYSSNGPASGSGGLRHGERRLLERVMQEAGKKRRARESLGRQANQRRSELRQYCRGIRTQLREAREHNRRKHLTSELRKHCW
jgi:hypothetical protein